MKKSMLLLLLPVMMQLSACHKSDGPNYKSTGQITGEDQRYCQCCGGFFITINSVQYRFDALPAGSDSKLLTNPLPIRVLLNWHPRPNACMEDLIVIDAIQKM